MQHEDKSLIAERCRERYYSMTAMDFLEQRDSCRKKNYEVAYCIKLNSFIFILVKHILRAVLTFSLCCRRIWILNEFCWIEKQKI